MDSTAPLQHGADGHSAPKPLSPDEDPEIRESVRQMHRAINEAVRAFPGGLKAVARELGKTPKRLQAEIDSLTSQERGRGKPKMGVDDVVDICKLTGDVRVLEAMLGPGCKLVPMPPPSEETDDPRRLLSAALRNFNVGAVVWAACHLDRLPTLAKAMGGFADLLAYAAALSDKPSVSKNDLRQLHELHFTLLSALDGLSGPVMGQVLSQSRADLHYAVKLLSSRLPEWARPAKRDRLRSGS